MNEQEDKRMRKQRDLWIGVALFGATGVYVFGIVSDGRDWQAWLFAIIGLVSGILALQTGRSLGQYRSAQRFARDENAVSPVIAVILMVAITVVLAAVVFVLVSDIGVNPPPPSIGFTVDSVEDTLTVTTISTNVAKWGEFNVTGCTKPGNDTTVDAGDELTDCSGSVKVVHVPSNTLIYSARFD